MNYCSNCGNKVEKDALFCLNCGVKLRDEISANSNNVVDTGGFVWALLGFFVPIAGLILFLVWKNDKPKTAKSAGKGALINVIFNVILVVLFSVFAFVLGTRRSTINDRYYDDYW